MRLSHCDDNNTVNFADTVTNGVNYSDNSKVINDDNSDV